MGLKRIQGSFSQVLAVQSTAQTSPNAMSIVCGVGIPTETEPNKGKRKFRSRFCEKMGKKHKKHRSDKPSLDQSVTRDLRAEPPLKLVLKVSGKTQDSKAETFDICLNKTEVARASHQSDDSRDSPARSESQKKKKKKKRKWQDVQASNSEQETETTAGTETPGETESCQEEQVMETDELVEKLKLPVSSKKKSKKQRYHDEESEKTEGLDQASVANDRIASDSGTESQRHAPCSKDKENVETMKGPLKKLLETLQKTLQRKDVDQFFAWPVNDVIAPGYSSIILHPMDFSNMRKKIDTSEYNNIDEYKMDFLQMCENATIYNRPETIYYKAAKRLQAVGLKCMSKEKISVLKRMFGYQERDELSRPKTKPSKRVPPGDVDQLTEESSLMDVAESEDSNLPSIVGSESIADGKDEDSTEDVIEEVLKAAKDARNRLSTRCPNSKLGFLRRDKAGTTTLAILNPSQGGVEETKHVNLGMLTGRLAQGTGTLPGFREDKRNKAIPVTYVSHGPFNTYGPQYDSSFANISKEDSDLLYSTYGDEAGVQYVQSIKDYVEDCDNYVVKLVDNLLDTLTKGQHSKTLEVLEQKKNGGQQTTSSTTSGESANRSEATDSQDNVKKEDTSGDNAALPPIQFDSLKSLSELGIDMSFLPTFEKMLGSETDNTATNDSAEIDSKLKSTSDLIGDLEKSQSARMSQKPPSHLQFIPKPSQQESNIAEKLTQQLLQLTSKIKPSDVISVEAAQSAIGITPNIHSELIEEVQILDKDTSPEGTDINQQQTPVT